MHLSSEFRRTNDWNAAVPDTFSPSPPLTPELNASYATHGAERVSDDGMNSGKDVSRYSSANGGSITETPRASWLPPSDFNVLLSLQEPCSVPVHPQTNRFPYPPYADHSRHINARPLSANSRTFQDLTLSDIEMLEEMAGSSGRRQSAAYRFDRHHVIKISPHASILYEVRVLAYVRRCFPDIPVPKVYETRCIQDVAGRDHFCLLMEYIDGVRADEALWDWGREETLQFMETIQALRGTISTKTEARIQAIGVDMDPNEEDSEMTGMKHDCADCVQSEQAPSHQQVQDELFDHIWQDMERGPFASEADFTAAIGVALRRRGAGASRVELVGSMVDRLPSFPSPPMAQTEETETSSGAGGRHRFPLQHANLTLGNILVRRTADASAPEIVGVLGWGQTGFYPPWWEMAKMAASEDRLLVDLAAADDAFRRYSQHASVMLHVRDIIY